MALHPKMVPVALGLTVVIIAFAIAAAPQQNAVLTPTPIIGEPAAYTLADVKTHSTPADCWTTINGSVYNLTQWIAQHPGGSLPIKMLCGKDGSSLFNEQHGGQGKPEQALATLKIGTLKP